MHFCNSVGSQRDPTESQPRPTELQILLYSMHFCNPVGPQRDPTEMQQMFPCTIVRPMFPIEPDTEPGRIAKRPGRIPTAPDRIAETVTVHAFLLSKSRKSLAKPTLGESCRMPMASCRIPLASCRMRQVLGIHEYPGHKVAKTFEFQYFLLAKSRKRFKNQHLAHPAGCRWHPAGFHWHPAECAKYGESMHFLITELQKHLNSCTFCSPKVGNAFKTNTWRILQDSIGILQDSIGILQNAPSIGDSCIS